MKMETIEDLLLTGMSYVLDFEERTGKAAQKMADAASDPELKEMFEKTVTKSGEYGQRIETAFEKLGKSKETNKNSIAVAMIDEVENMISNTEAGAVRDAALIVAVNQQQAYRAASYGSLASYAALVGKDDAVSELNSSLEESKSGDKKFTDIAESRGNKEATKGTVVA